MRITKQSFNQWVKMGWALKVVQNHIYEYMETECSKQLNPKYVEKMEPKGKKAWKEESRRLRKAWRILDTLKSDLEDEFYKLFPKKFLTSVFYGQIDEYYNWKKAEKEKKLKK